MSLLKNLFKGKDSKKEKTDVVDQADFIKLSKSDFESFTDLLEQNGVLSFEKQLTFGEVIGSNPWQFDMDKGEISFGGDLVFGVQIIGSISFADNSWMWGWANQQSGIPERLLVQSFKLKDLGEGKNISELKNPHFNVDGRFDHRIGMIASGLFKSNCYYSANYGKGSLVCTIDSSKIPNVKNDFIKISTTFTQFIADIEISHKEAFINYLIDKEYLIKFDGDSIRGLKDKVVIKAEFDNYNRLLNIKNE
jgi:hypothetical protein